MAEPTKPYTVLRAICMAGERVEIGETVELTAVQYAELATAGKVGPYVETKRSRKKAAEPAPIQPVEPVAPVEPMAPSESPAPEPAADSNPSEGDAA